MTTVFLDTVGLLALWDTSDQWHAEAEAAFAKVRQERSRLLTTTFVLLECGNAAARRPYREVVDRLREHLESSGTLVVPSDDDWRRAWRSYRDAEFGNAGIVDCVSFAVMRRLALVSVFSNDQHFRRAGFQTLF